MIELAALKGRWRLFRRIEDRRAGVTGHLQGESVWRPDDAGLRQEESGSLIFGDAPPMPASRIYLWRADGIGLAIFFEDGRPFHSIAPDRLRARHWCDPDTYDVTYAVDAWPVWHQVWRVSGPRKNLILDSRFEPIERF